MWPYVCFLTLLSPTSLGHQLSLACQCACLHSSTQLHMQPQLVPLLPKAWCNLRAWSVSSMSLTDGSRGHVGTPTASQATPTPSACLQVQSEAIIWPLLRLYFYFSSLFPSSQPAWLSLICLPLSPPEPFLMNVTLPWLTLCISPGPSQLPPSL